MGEIVAKSAGNAAQNGIKKRMTLKATANAPDKDVTEDARYQKAQKRIKRLRKNNSDSLADVATLKYIRDVAMELLPIAVTQYKTWKNDRSMIALRNLIEQVKDTMIALRSQEKGKKECEHIINQILTPDLQIMMHHTLRECGAIKSQLSFLSASDRKKVIVLIDSMSANTGQSFNAVSGMMNDKITEYMVGKQ